MVSYLRKVKKMKKKVLILGAGGSAGINYTKCIKDKFNTVGLDSSIYNIHLSECHQNYLDPSQNSYQRVKLVRAILKKEKIDFIHAQPDKSVLFLSLINDARKLMPSFLDVSKMQLKNILMQNLKDLDIPHPKTKHFVNLNKLSFNMFRNFKDPLWLRCSHGAGGRGSLLVKNYKEAKNWVEYWSKRGISPKEFIVSEYLPGREVSWQSVWYDGNLICSTARERLGWMGGHTSTSGVSGTTAYQRIIKGEQFNDIAIKTIRNLVDKPHGIFSVDLKENKKGVPCVMEINPGRFSTTSQFMKYAGCNMAYIHAYMGIYGKVPKEYKNLKSVDSCKIGHYCLRVPDGKFTVKKLK